MKTSKGIYTGYREEEMKEYIQDLIFSQSMEYDKERDFLSHYRQPLRQQKRLFSKFNRARNRRNSYIFAKHYNTRLPF